MFRRILAQLRKFISHPYNVTATGEKSDTDKRESIRLGRTIYTSESREEAEKSAGEKLYKITDGVYINQATQDFIHSEHHPFVEFQFVEAFSEYFHPDQEAVCAVWHPVDPKLFCISKSSDQSIEYQIISFEKNSFLVGDKQRIELSHVNANIIHVAHHPSSSYLLLTLNSHLIIWDYLNQTSVAGTVTGDRQMNLGGFYPQEAKVWVLVMSEHTTGHNWMIWDYSTDELNVFELERYDHYGRGSVLHPSGLLIGALWNAYGCGYLLHDALPREDRLSYFSQPAPERPEYEAYSPCFSPEGKRLAFIANPYLAMRKNHSKICVYDIENANLIIEFYSGTSLTESQMQFVHDGKTLAFREVNSPRLHVFDAQTGKKRATLQTTSSISYFDGHHLEGCYAAVHQTGITIFISDLIHGDKIEQKYEQRAREIAEVYIASNAAYITTVNQEID